MADKSLIICYVERKNGECKNIMRNVVNEMVGVFHSELEKVFKVWHILSWSMLAAGYSLLIIAYTLFGEPPLWLTFFGLVGVVVTLFNFFIALFVDIYYFVKAHKENDIELKNRAYFVFAYLVTAGLMYFAVTI